MIDLEQAVSLLRDAQDIEILGHHFPGGDTLSYAVAFCHALQLMGKQARCTCTDPVSEKYDFLFNEIERQEFPARFVVDVDVADVKLLGPMLTMKHTGEIDPCIGHHDSHQDFAENLYVDNIAAATCGITYEVICRLGIAPDQVTVQVVCTGITTNTGCSRYSSTTVRTREIAMQVIRTSIDAGNINRQMFGTKAHTRLEMERSALGSIVFYFNACCTIMCISRTIIEASGASEDDLDGLPAIPRQIEDVLVSMTTRERKVGGYKVSLRTQPQMNAAKICAEFGGGGRVAAAGCTIKKDFKPTREKLLAIVGKALETIRGDPDEWNPSNR